MVKRISVDQIEVESDHDEVGELVSIPIEAMEDIEDDYDLDDELPDDLLEPDYEEMHTSFWREMAQRQLDERRASGQ